MRPAVSRTTVLAAELQAVRAAQDFRNNLQRVRGTFHRTLVSPPVLASTVAVTGLYGFWLARRTRNRPPATVRAVPSSAMASAFRLMLAFVMRQGLQQILEKFRN